MKPVIVITHAAFCPKRRQSLARLVSQLRMEASTLEMRIAVDDERKGSLWCWRRAMEMGLQEGATHVVWLPDDAILCRDFGDILAACIKARPDDVFDCFVNTAKATDVGSLWFSTTDGYTGMAGVMPAALLRQHLAWRDERPELADYPNDAGVNLWAQQTRRLIYKTSFSLVQHDTSLESLDGHDDQGKTDGIERTGTSFVDDVRAGILEDVCNFLGRTYAAPVEHRGDRATASTHVGRVYKGNHWDAARVLAPHHWDLDAMYDAHEPVPEGGLARVVIVVPVYRETAEILEKTRPSRDAVAEDLTEHGVDCVIWQAPGDSHVDRMRQRATHGALKLGATHVLFWDADISCDDPKTVRKMLLSGHDIVAGACPFRADGGRVVCNLLPETQQAMAAGKPLALEGGCLEVQHAGSGFMMISRKALLAMFKEHNDLMHLSRSPGDEGEPLWAIWDATVVAPPEDSGLSWRDTVRLRAFETEDWMFCRLWQDMGGKVYVHVPSTFRHWGTFGFRGSFAEQHGLQRAV